ncbi:hypothetical protein CYMTET_56918 [Cymbomonas tetramitiformis]|uniref:Thioredoxin domain-containing protein n=1 Tax=Cymbomonas tetramitiformis TaxID=36881 RepID=A0AAE0ELC9_9CHLO|nr:hypothetical protein CYMTET_56918 [Cymbomonas tetramitiformis]
MSSGAVSSLLPRRASSAFQARRQLSVTSEGLVQQLTAEELEVAIAEREVPIIIDFFATWCGPCVLLAAELEKVAEELGDTVRIVKVDTDQEQALASQLQIQGLPTVVFVGMDNSKPALRTEGLLGAEVIKNIIEQELS